MPELSRRSFLIGTSAAIAAAAIPASELITPVPAQAPFTKRLITDFKADWDVMREAGYRTVFDGMLTISRVGGSPIVQIGFSPYASIWWSAAPGNEIIVLPNHLISVEMTHYPGRIEMYCRDWYEGEEEPIAVVEEHVFPRWAPPQILPVSMDDMDRFKRSMWGRA